ncbi:hypothetical protein EYC80_008462 [Monilinia laxa]|uniref:Phosphoribosyltransferase domain-containing protein n=1 Tax=Monilinia laxa TaxID=61186 RepID=A0A5N6JT81_MONLA|nr:hypothetical protein EYC80_008462 [Monilinia laxa]
MIDSVQEEHFSITPKAKSIVIGIYGLPGSGKSCLRSHLRRHPKLPENAFEFIEGSEVIARDIEGGLEAFHQVSQEGKLHRRETAIHSIQKSPPLNQVSVVTGHFMFWSEDDESGDQVWAASDLEMWQDIEQDMLEALCRESGIVFPVLVSTSNLVADCAQQLCNFRLHAEEHNLKHAEDRLDEIFGTNREKLETVLVIDGDKTLTSMDTGAIFWDKVGKSNDFKWVIDGSDPLKKLFGGPLSYSYAAFHQVSLLYETLSKDDFDVFCDKVASEVVMYSESVPLLQRVSEQEHVLAREGLPAIKVIAAGRLEDYLVVTALVKVAVMDRLYKHCNTHVWAFGDSPLDLKMLSRADEAIVVVGEEQSRRKAMDTLLMSGTEHKTFRARQAVLPRTAPPRLDTTRMSLVQLASQNFIESILRSRDPNFYTELRILQATDRVAAKLLMAPMRNANISGHILREAHHRVGYYLAIELLGNVLGIEQYLVPHVQGHTASGFRVLHEYQTLIVALMRGGEPMAFGVSEALPLATYLHAKDAEDIKATHGKGQRNVVLVDSVANSGKTMVEFAEHIRKLHATIRIVVVADVVQSEIIHRSSAAKAFTRSGDSSIVALRLSENKFRGKGTTDTENRTCLFNTTYLP